MTDNTKKTQKIIVTGKSDYNAIVQSFMHEYGLHKIIAFSGGADNQLDGVWDETFQNSYNAILQERENKIIGQAIRKFQGYRIAILSGGTDSGIPKTAVVTAKQYNLKTIGVYPHVGKKHALEDKYLDLSICVEPSYSESYWGDESPIFTKLLDAVIVYGGGAGTLVEVAHLLKMNEMILKREGIPKLIVPIAGTGGVADGLPFIWSKTRIRQMSMPSKRIMSGGEAADLLIEELKLEDYYAF